MQQLHSGICGLREAQGCQKYKNPWCNTLMSPSCPNADRVTAPSVGFIFVTWNVSFQSEATWNVVKHGILTSYLTITEYFCARMFTSCSLSNNLKTNLQDWCHPPASFPSPSPAPATAAAAFLLVFWHGGSVQHSWHHQRHQPKGWHEVRATQILPACRCTPEPQLHLLLCSKWMSPPVAAENQK